MTTAISIEDVRREVKILKALSGHNNLVKFHDACEDALNVYIIMEYVDLILFLVLYLFTFHYYAIRIFSNLYIHAAYGIIRHVNSFVGSSTS